VTFVAFVGLLVMGLKLVLDVAAIAVLIVRGGLHVPVRALTAGVRVVALTAAAAT